MGRSYQAFPAHAGRPQPQQDQVLEPALHALVDFVRVRLLNFAVAGLLTVGYLLYQYWGLLFVPKQEEDDEYNARLPRSRSRSRTRERDYKMSSRYSHRRHGHGRRHSDYDR